MLENRAAEAGQRTSVARRQSATLDEQFVYSRFADAFGRWGKVAPGDSATVDPTAIDWPRVTTTEGGPRGTDR